MATYETYNSLDEEANGIYVEIPMGDDGQYDYWSRIAEHGLERIIKDGGWRINRRGWQQDANFILDWGSGPRVELRNGKVTLDERTAR